MKLSLAFFAVLIASTSAAPVHLITTTSDLERTPEDVSVYPPEALADAISPHITVETVAVHAEQKPCHGASPLSALLSRLGLTMPASRIIGISAGPFSHPHPHLAHSRPHGHDGHSQTNRESLFEAWRQHLADRVPALSTSQILPIMGDDSAEAGDHVDTIKWWRPASEGKWEVKDGQGEWRVPRLGEKPPRAEREKEMKHGLWRQEDFLLRLRHAFKHLTHAETTAFAFVTGVGIGSITHFIVIFILTVRRLRSSPEDRLSRRAARRAARKARKNARKTSKGGMSGSLYLAGEEHIPGQVDAVEKAVERDEELPVYDEGEDAHFVCEKYEAA